MELATRKARRICGKSSTNISLITHRELNHQGLEGLIFDPEMEIGCATGKICRRERLGGMLNYYYRDAA